MIIALPATSDLLQLVASSCRSVTGLHRIGSQLLQARRSGSGLYTKAGLPRACEVFGGAAPSESGLCCRCACCKLVSVLVLVPMLVKVALVLAQVQVMVLTMLELVLVMWVLVLCSR